MERWKKEDCRKDQATPSVNPNCGASDNSPDFVGFISLSAEWVDKLSFV
jgi:hypothetical protein